MGEVWLADQPSLHRKVAIKVLAPELALDPSFADRFQREAQTLAKLDHPNVLRIFDFGEIESLYYIVMEYHPGNLREYLASAAFRQRCVTPEDRVEQVLELFASLCAAVEYAHAKGVIHRDVKPENVLVNDNGLKLADFGLARLLAAPGEDGRLMSGYPALGTPCYVAPEQLERPQEVDQRADVYSLGVVLYEMLTDELPQKPLVLPSRRGLDDGLDYAVLTAMHPNPAFRFRKVKDLSAYLKRIHAPSWQTDHAADVRTCFFLGLAALVLCHVATRINVASFALMACVLVLVENRKWSSRRLRKLAWILGFGACCFVNCVGPWGGQPRAWLLDLWYFRLFDLLSALRLCSFLRDLTKSIRIRSSALWLPPAERGKLKRWLFLLFRRAFLTDLPILLCILPVYGALMAWCVPWYPARKISNIQLAVPIILVLGWNRRSWSPLPGTSFFNVFKDTCQAVGYTFVALLLYAAYPATAAWGPLILAAVIVVYLGVNTALKHYPRTKRVEPPADRS
jgi:serine/threonine protein kinase